MKCGTCTVICAFSISLYMYMCNKIDPVSIVVKAPVWGMEDWGLICDCRTKDIKCFCPLYDAYWSNAVIINYD